jgi:hypothetical protein
MKKSKKDISPIYLSEAIDMLLKLRDARIHTYDEVKMYDAITDMLVDCKTQWSEEQLANHRFSFPFELLKEKR